MVAPAVAAAGITTAGSLLGGLFGSSSAKKQNKLAALEAAKSREFVREQMQNKHQWEVEDLKKAGLNPVLSAGANASIGGSAQAPVIGEIDGVEKGMSSALATKRLIAEIENINADTEKKEAETATTDNQGALIRKQWNVLDAKMPAISQSAKAQKAHDRIEEKWFKSKSGKFFKAIDHMLGSVNPFSQASAKKLAQ